LFCKGFFFTNKTENLLVSTLTIAYLFFSWPKK
jgi:hypothetical protein